ncbi:MAG: cell division protein ZapA [Gemmatimonadales bacterium]|nr:MAG: cell division protein ZapA [Gemmatimonadales bacterium]
MTDASRTAVRVTIFGDEYALRSEAGADYTRACAAHVDERVQSVHVSGHVSEPHKAAILAAMQITDELFQVRADQEGQSELVHGRIGELRKRVDVALNRGATQAELGS